MERYAVYYEQNNVGYVDVSKEGLFTKFQCKCKLPENDMYRLIVNHNRKETDLGICVPYKGFFVANKSISRKQIGEGEMTFLIHTCSKKNQTSFVPVVSDRPFPYLSIILHAHFGREGGHVGLFFDSQLLSQ